MRAFISVYYKVLLIAASILAGTLALQATSEPDGAEIYKQRCVMCHGADGKGYPALKTPDFTDPKWHASVTDKEIIQTIKEGKKGTAMPAFGEKLKDDEIQALVKFVRSLNSAKKQ